MIETDKKGSEPTVKELRAKFLVLPLIDSQFVVAFVKSDNSSILTDSLGKTLVRIFLYIF